MIKPWKIIEHNWSDTSISDGDKTVCSLSIYDFGQVTYENQSELETEVSALAKRIAAVPELEALLKEFAETAPGSVEYSDWPEMQSLVERARALTENEP